MTKEPWFESDNPSTVVRSAGWRLGVVVLAVVIFCGALSIALWGFGVFTSDVKGQGDAIKEKNSSTNRIQAQQEYVEQFNNVKAADLRVTAAFQALQLDPTSQVSQTNYTGTVNFCIGAVADYNKLGQGPEAH